jgi:PAS domain S-box-containing protein
VRALLRAPSASDELDRLVVRMFLVVAATSAAAGLLVTLLLRTDVAPSIYWAMMALSGSYAVSAPLAALLVHRRQVQAGVALLLAGTYVGTTAFALVSQIGVHSVSFGFYGLLIVVAGLLIGVRAAIVAGSVCAATLIALFVAERVGAIEGADALARLPLYNRLLAHLLIVFVGTVVGVIGARVLVASLRAAKAQEHQLGGLLAIGSDFHWTQDTELRFTSLRTRHADDRWLPMERYIGRRRWEVPGTAPVEGSWDAHRARLDARQPFRDLLIRVDGVMGRDHFISVSGEPLLGGTGEFRGYWGVGRLVTREVGDKLALRASEQRYRCLFDLSPSPLILHRAGAVLTANAAAAALFGYADAAQMRGLPMLELSEGASRDTSAERIVALESMAAGASLPHVTLAMRTRDGRALHVLASMVRVDVDDGAACLSMYHDVTEARRVELQLAQAREQAESASRAKSAFLANMTHEIRTPLNGVLGLARLAIDHDADAGRRRQYLQHVIASAESLSAMVNDVLDLSKIEAGKLDLERAALDLPALLSSVAAVHGELAAHKGLALSVELSPDLPRWVVGDPVRVRQIVVNFVGNAIKFTERGAVVLQAAPAAEGQVRVAVRDTGIGIDAPTQKRLFEPFSQADETTTRRYGGTGLGLSVCRQLAQHMGGTVGVDSVPGCGSSFWALLPLPATDAPAAVAPPAEHAGQTLQGRRVLLVEDNPVNQLIAQTLLADWGMDVHCADNGRAAIAAVEQAAAADAAFEIVLMDVHMPEMNGCDATIALRRQFTADALPIIALTAAALSDEKARCLAAGMNDFVTKPMEAATLREALVRQLAGRPARA